jgi:hypothetical protein
MEQGPPSHPAPAKTGESGPPAPADAGTPTAPETRPQTTRGGLGATLKRSYHGVRRFAMALFGYPSGRWPAPTVTSLLVAALVVVAAVELLPKTASDVTLSVRARTEVLELELDPLRTYVWWLPAGTYSLLTAKVGSGCSERKRFDVSCTYAVPSAITIKNGATVRFEMLPAAADGGLRFSAALTPRKAPPKEPPPPPGRDTVASSFEVHDANDELLVETGDLLTFESGSADPWRIPLILHRVQIGASLSESISTSDTLGPVLQPIMLEGDVRIFARSLGSNDRYQIQEESFDAADVVQIPADPTNEGELLIGVLSLDRNHEGEHAFDITLHTALAEVFVRRLGAEHLIGVSMWSVVSQLPTWAALWIVWVSLIVVANYHAARLQQLQGDSQ